MQMVYIGDTKYGRHVGTDRAGNKFFENMEELPRTFPPGPAPASSRRVGNPIILSRPTHCEPRGGQLGDRHCCSLKRSKERKGEDMDFGNESFKARLDDGLLTRSTSPL